MGKTTDEAIQAAEATGVVEGRGSAASEDLIARLFPHEVDGAQEECMAELRHFALEYGAAVELLVPGHREQALALTKLEESLRWAIAGVARRG